MDSFEKINKKTDSSYLLAKESLMRNFPTFHLNPNNVHVCENEIILNCSILTLSEKNEIFFNEQKIKKRINDFDFFFIRQDPPFDMNYVTNTYLLELVKKSENSEKPFFIAEALSKNFCTKSSLVDSIRSSFVQRDSSFFHNEHNSTCLPANSILRAVQGFKEITR